MKYWLTILFFGLIINVKAQTTPGLEKKLRLLEEPSPFEADTLGFSTLPKFDYICWDKYSFKNLHLMDLNNDGLKDVIFSGLCNPYPQAAIFINNGKELKQLISYSGAVIGIDKMADRTIIYILKEACCCDYYTDYIEITIDNQLNLTKNTITFHGDTKIITGKRLVELKTFGKIRTMPEVYDEEEKDDCTNEITKGNVLLNIELPTKTIQLNKVKKWRLVLFQENKEQSWIGWMKIKK